MSFSVPGPPRWMTPNALINASRAGNLPEVTRIVRAGVDVNANEEHEDEWTTPLNAASKNGHLDVVRFLVNNGANVNKKDFEGITAIYFAAKGRGGRDMSAVRGDHLDVVRFLVNNGAKDINDALTSSIDSMGYRMNSSEINEQLFQIIQFLVEEAGANINISRDGGRPLDGAIDSGNLKLVKYLVERGVSIHYSDIDGNSPVSGAVTNSSVEILRYLLNQGARVDVAFRSNHQWRQNGWTPLHFVSAGRSMADTSNHYYYQMQMRAYLPMARLLLEFGANVDNTSSQPGSVGNTPLISLMKTAVDYNSLDTHHIEMIKLLLRFGADVNKTNDQGDSAISIAIGEVVHLHHSDLPTNHFLRAITLLLRAGANLEIGDETRLREINIYNIDEDEGLPDIRCCS